MSASLCFKTAFGVDRFSMQEERTSDKMLFQAADWEPIASVTQRACWSWLGHVARMHIPALPKLALWVGHLPPRLGRRVGCKALG